MKESLNDASFVSAYAHHDVCVRVCVCAHVFMFIQRWGFVKNWNFQTPYTGVRCTQMWCVCIIINCDSVFFWPSIQSFIHSCAFGLSNHWKKNPSAISSFQFVLLLCDGRELRFLARVVMHVTQMYKWHLKSFNWTAWTFGSGARIKALYLLNRFAHIHKINGQVKRHGMANDYMDSVNGMNLITSNLRKKNQSFCVKFQRIFFSCVDGSAWCLFFSCHAHSGWVQLPY